MAEESNKDQYIICSKCKRKYINDEEHIKQDFGYKRSEERYKTCVRCRARNKINCKTYYDKHKEERIEYLKKYREEHKEQAKEYDKQYREKNADRLKIKMKCPNCDSEICKNKFLRHQRTNKCKTY